MNEKIRRKSFIRIYWYVWFVLVFLLLASRFSIFKSSPENVLFNLFSIYFVPTWIAVMILNRYEGNRLMSHLKQNHRAKWEHITYVPFFGYGYYNGFRSLPFLYSKDDLGDQMVTELKKNYRRFIILALTIFFTFPVLFLTLMLT